MIAPLAAIDAVEAATKLPFEEGCKLERKLFMDCLFSDQSKALIHVFFGEREVAKIPDIPKDTRAHPSQYAPPSSAREPWAAASLWSLQTPASPCS